MQRKNIFVYPNERTYERIKKIGILDVKKPCALLYECVYVNFSNFLFITVIYYIFLEIV